MNAIELKQNLISFLKDNPRTFDAGYLAKLFGVKVSEVTAILSNEPSIVMSKYNGRNIFSHKRDAETVAMKSRMTGFYKHNLAMQQAIERCRESRGEEFRPIVMTGSEKMFNHIDV